MRERTVNGAFGRRGVGVYLADARDARVCLHSDDESVLPAVALLPDLFLSQINGFYPRDLQGRPISAES